MLMVLFSTLGNGFTLHRTAKVCHLAQVQSKLSPLAPHSYPTLQQKRFELYSTEPTAAAVPAEGAEQPKPAAAASPKTLKKILPLGAMLFFILFNYTILRDTKDVLVVTAPNSGAEIIPFLKTYVNLPSAIGFTVLYSYLSNKMPADKVFYVVMTSFLTFFGAFAGIICKSTFASL